MSASTFYLHANDPGRAAIRANAVAFLDQLPRDKSWRVTIEKHAKDYTGKQRRSIFGPAYAALMAFSGLAGDDDKHELHRFMCGEFFGWCEHALGRKPVRTTTIDERGKKNPISTEEAIAFYEFLQRRGAEVGCYVPDPNPFWREKAAR